MSDNRRLRVIPLITQEKLLKKHYPNCFVKRNRKSDSLTWVGQLRPTPLSKKYTVLVLLKNNKVETFVIEPKKLILYEGETKLPHVYSTPRQKLCLFFPDGKEWNRSFLISDTIIPWASEWLYYYELWLITGKWLGGGIEHNEEKRS